jgi:hypothetical protein
MERNMNSIHGQRSPNRSLTVWSGSSCPSYLNPFPLQCRIVRNLPFRRLAIPALPLTKSEECCSLYERMPDPYSLIRSGENQRLEPLATTVIGSSYGLQNFFMVPCPLYHSCCPRRVVFLAQCHNLTHQDIGPYQTPCHSGTSCCLRACQITKRNYSGLRPGALGKTSLYERCTIQVDCLRGMSQPFQVQIFFLNIVRTLAINSCIGQEQRPRCHVFGIYSRSSSLSTTLMDPGNLHFLQKLYSPAFRCSKSD